MRACWTGGVGPLIKSCQSALVLFFLEVSMWCEMDACSCVNPTVGFACIVSSLGLWMCTRVSTFGRMVHTSCDCSPSPRVLIPLETYDS